MIAVFADDRARRPAPTSEAAPTRVLAEPGRRLDPGTARRMAAAYRFDFTDVRVHADAEGARSAAALDATAYTVGNHVVFGQDRYAPGTAAGDELIAHELWHVVQQRGRPSNASAPLRVGPAHDGLEREADRAASGDHPPAPSVTEPSVQRRVELRDVGRGEQSGFARRGDIVARLDALSAALTYELRGADLAYQVTDAAALSEFDRQMMGFIDDAAVLPLRLTNRSGLRKVGATYDAQVLDDSFQGGYLDVDDFLASTDLGLQTMLVHVLAERAAVRDYDRRIGTPGLEATAQNPEFMAAHASGKTAEEVLLRDFFGDPTVRLLPDPVLTPADVQPGKRFTIRNYTNSRRDTIRWRIRRGAGATAGVDANSIQVRTRDGRTMTPEEYRDLLRAEAAAAETAAQIDRERLGGATEHREGGRGVPAP